MFYKLLKRLLYESIEDLCSFRNKLIIVTSIFMFIALKTGNSTIVGTVGTFWTLILGYYLQLRHKAQNGDNIHKSNFGNEINKNEQK